MSAPPGSKVEKLQSNASILKSQSNQDAVGTQAAVNAEPTEVKGHDPYASALVGGYWKNYYESKKGNICYRTQASSVKEAASDIFNTLAKQLKIKSFDFVVKNVENGRKTKFHGYREKSDRKDYRFINHIRFA